MPLGCGPVVIEKPVAIFTMFIDVSAIELREVMLIQLEEIPNHQLVVIPCGHHPKFHGHSIADLEQT